MNTSTIGERLNQALEYAGMSQTDLAKAIRVTPQAVQFICAGKTKRTRYSAAIAKALRISPDWLENGRGQMVQARLGQPPSVIGDDSNEIGTPIVTWEKPEDLPEGHYVIVPRYDVQVAAGNGHVIYDEKPLEQGHAYRTRFIKEKGLYARHLISIYAIGGSMEPRIRSGDSLLVDRSQTAVKDGMVYVLSFGGEVKVKRLFKRPDGGLLVVSDNKVGHADMTIEAKDMPLVTLIGEVIEVSGPP